jgi:DNA-binding response OmpR family regulator
MRGTDSLADYASPSAEKARPLRFSSLVLDLDACMLAHQSGEPIPLTHGEFALLRVFVTRPGRVLSRDTLLSALGDRRFEPFDRSVDVLAGKLRRRIEIDPKLPQLIITVRGEGYRFDGLKRVGGAQLELPSIALATPAAVDAKISSPPLGNPIKFFFCERQAES